jgi:superfamily I DNA and RNA helicase
VGSEDGEGLPNAVVQRPAESAAHMAAQGPQVTLGGATRGDVVEAKGPAQGRDNLGHGHALGLLLLSRLGKRLAVLDGLVKSRLKP